ncbi:MAG: cytochrome c [Acidobacteriota bacterium]|nr:c-type cytochrome [Blastocatellia bacterium]MDW8239334.1 cytochrome c [Acidobacteriota bacterium]
MMKNAGVILMMGFLAAWMLGVSVTPDHVVAWQDEGFISKGQELYREHCATCHGLDAKGNGPAARALKKKPTDLTRIQQPGEKFPAYRVLNAIEGEKITPAHGSREMPVWGTIFRRTKGSMQEKGDIYALMKYVESIQVHAQ